MKNGIGTSHGKIILMGEHSVVYGYPAIAIPLRNIIAKCTIERSVGRFIWNRKDTLSTAIHTALKYLKKENARIKYLASSNIPPRRGLGSSAAISIAGVRGIFDYFARGISTEELEMLVNEAEKVAHGTPSGLDAKVCLSDSAIKFIRDKGFWDINMALEAFLVIGDTGIYGNTAEAVAMVREKGKEAEAIMERLGKLTEEAERNIGKKDVTGMGRVMTEAHEELKKLGVSIGKADMLVEASIEAGAAGAKMSGGGLGGCIIALAENMEKAENIRKKLKEEGAVNIWTEKL